MRNALIVGGNSGIGLALSLSLLRRNYEHIYIVGKDAPNCNDIPASDIEMFNDKTSFFKLNLISEEYEVFDSINNIDTLIITAGFGRVCTFENLSDIEVNNLIKCNMLSAIRIIKKYYSRLNSQNDFYCAVIGSIAGHVCSPLFSVYGASKFGLCSFIENVNVELMYNNIKNRILDVSPGSLKGTNFNGNGNDLAMLNNVADSIVEKMLARDTLYIPQYEEIYKDVINRYISDKCKYGLESYEYKIKNNRISTKPQVVIGYLSGTFDLFHIGHLNLLKRAKEQCDYLVVGVHKSGAWKGKETFIPYDERVSIVKSICYVDEVIQSFPEDSDAYNVIHYDKLFVGSDYKGTERFIRYEEYFKDKGVEIVYFPYTNGTSSTQLREALSKTIKNS